MAVQAQAPTWAMPAEAASPAQAVLPTMPVVRFNGHRRWQQARTAAYLIDDSNNVTGAGNVTLSGELDAATGDFSGIIDVAGAARSPACLCTLEVRLVGGYGSTGATISTAGVGQFNGALTTDGSTSEGDALTIGGTALLANDTNNRVTTATG